jgi:flagellar protein FliJ
MARFVFRLESVLRQRKEIERQAQRQLAGVMAQMQELQHQLKGINDNVNDATADLRTNHLLGPIDLNYLAAHRRFIAATQRGALQLMQRMALMQRQIDEARGLLIAAAQRRKAVEKLRERQFDRWREDMARKENADLDETGMQMSYQRTSGDAMDLVSD